MEKEFQEFLIFILANLTARKNRKLSAYVPCPLSSQTAEFFSVLVDIMTNNTQYTIVLIINIITLKSPLGLAQKIIKRSLLLVLGI